MKKFLFYLFGAIVKNSQFRLGHNIGQERCWCQREVNIAWGNTQLMVVTGLINRWFFRSENTFPTLTGFTRRSDILCVPSIQGFWG